jgi:3-phenylpropionate/cinnamic acid dioxygenase small subunit
MKVVEVTAQRVEEAELLDNNQMREWLALLAPEIEYLMPVRVTRERSAGPGFRPDSFHMREDMGSIRARIERLETEYAWAEDPPSRLRRFVSNFRIRPGEDEDEIRALTNVLVFRGRYDLPSFELICAERRDILQRTSDGGLLLARREVLLDHTSVGTPSSSDLKYKD